MKSLKLNLFAVPSQTAVLFWLIAITLVGAIVFGTAGTAPVPIGWLAPVLVLLSLWSFLSRPDRDLRKGRLVPIGGQFPLLQETVRNRSKQIGLQRIPAILLSNENRKIYIMGSFRRWYIVLGRQDVQTLENLLSQSENSDLAELKILHELYHFKNGDYWQLGLLTELFQTVFPLMLWFMLFFGGWMFILGLASQSLSQLSPAGILERMPPEVRPLIEQIFSSGLPSASELDALLTKAAGINFLQAASFVFNIALPFMFIAAFLWFFYLPLVWQMREFYADAGMVQTLGTTAPFWRLLTNVFDESVANVQVSNSTLKILWERIVSVFSKINEFMKERREFSPYGRTEALLAPQKVFYHWRKIALYLAGLALVLEIFLATPLTLPLIGQNPMHFATLVILVAMAYFLLPQLVLGQSGWLDALRIIIIINSVRFLWLLLTLGFLWVLYFFEPHFLDEVLRSAIYSTARYAGNDSFELNLYEFLIKASFSNLLQVPIIFAMQIISISGLIFLFRRILTWYSFFTTSEMFKKIVLGLTVGMAFVLLLTVLPLSTAILIGNLNLLSQPVMIFQFVLGTAILIGGTVWFVRQDRRYSRKCPICKADVSRSGPLYESCQACGNVLFPWLWTEYQDE